MKLSDTVEALLKSKGEGQVLSVEPDQSVYEPIEKMVKAKKATARRAKVLNRLVPPQSLAGSSYSCPL